MKKKTNSLKRLFVCIVLLCTCQSSFSQSNLPSTWDSFVKGKNNIPVRDTFLLQTFSDTNSSGWRYETQGTTKIEDISELDPSFGQHSDTALKLSLDSKIMFEEFDPKQYTERIISFRAAGTKLMIGENLAIKAYRPSDNDDTITAKAVTSNNSTIKFFRKKIINNPPRVDFITSEPSSKTQNGYYYIDSVYVHGIIPKYSLFTGSGNWDEDKYWSHLPALRHRSALINGKASINTAISCEDLFIGTGSINISSTGDLSINSLTIYSDDNSSECSSFSSKGNVRIKNNVTIKKTFKEKGKWYFISFPFDVYRSNIDSSFIMGDDKNKTNGNYFYVRTYNNEKRAKSQTLSGNWEVMTQPESSEPIFKKNIGYLISIDEGADTQTLSFSSKKGKIPNNFGKKGEIKIQTTINKNSDNQDHNGWFLCGNPLPAPLHVKQIEPNAALDGYVYIYNGTDYHAHALTGDFIIPAFSAFFIKANQNTVLIINSENHTVAD